jgi:predicted nuclease with TOPRIM domain
MDQQDRPHSTVNKLPEDYSHLMKVKPKLEQLIELTKRRDALQKALHERTQEMARDKSKLNENLHLLQQTVINESETKLKIELIPKNHMRKPTQRHIDDSVRLILGDSAYTEWKTYIKELKESNQVCRKIVDIKTAKT